MYRYIYLFYRKYLHISRKMLTFAHKNIKYDGKERYYPKDQRADLQREG